MPRTVAREVPRWKQRGKKNNLPGFTPADRQFTAAVAREVARAQAAAAREPGEGREGTRAGSRGTAARNDVLARTGAWRFRRHLRPFLALAALLAVAAILHGVPLRWLWAGLASLVIPATMAGAARLKGRDGKPLASAWVRRYTDLEGLWAGLWLPFLAVRGDRACIVALLLTWLPFAGLWVRRYRWQPAPPEKTAASPVGDMATWGKLAERKKWAGHLENPRLIANGRQYDIILDGTQTHIGQIIAEPRALAAAWDSAQTETYAEPAPTGIESRGTLTLLSAGTLESVREWDGQGFSEDGIACIGRFADGMPTRIRGWVPMDGTRHSMFSGASGSGKTAALDLVVQLALASVIPVIPVILDPQNGQSLPQWKDRLLYAAGVEECVRFERGLLAGMLDRSERMAKMTWEDEDGFKMKGLDFYDYRICGLGVVMVITDEAPELLGGGGNAKLGAEMTRIQASRAKLGRKAGDMEILVAQVPSLGELGGNQALRSMFVGGNVVSLRTGEKVSQGMLGLSVDPYTLPKYFPNGEATQGLGYAVALDNRQAPFRSDLVPKRLRREKIEVPALEPEFLEAMDKAMGGVSPTSALVPADPLVVRAIHEAGALIDRAESAEAALRRQVPSPEPADDAPEGRRCIDAVWLVLSSRAQDMTRGEVIKWTGDLAETWDRKKWTVKAIQTALGALTEGTDPKHRADGHQVTREATGVYRAVTVQSPANDAK